MELNNYNMLKPVHYWIGYVLLLLIIVVFSCSRDDENATHQGDPQNNENVQSVGASANELLHPNIKF